MAQWGYCKHNGPETWPKTFPAAGGRKQSPIDIRLDDSEYDEQLAKTPLHLSYNPDSAQELINTGASLQLRFNPAGGVEGGPLNSKYQLVQFHFHWGKTSDRGSEHTINGKTYPAEVHMVHMNTEKYKSLEEAIKHPDGLCVLGVLFKVGKEHKGIQKLLDHVKSVQHRDKTMPLGSFDPSCLLPDTKGQYWTYAGSLTTPPCLECITWIVFHEQIELSEQQTFRTLYSAKEGEQQLADNYRPPCPLNDRQLRASFQPCGQLTNLMNKICHS